LVVGCVAVAVDVAVGWADELSCGFALELAPFATVAAALVTGAVTPDTEDVAAEVSDETGAVTADVSPESPDGGSSVVAAWACLEESSTRKKKIPAATTANCAARRATRRATGCGIDSSHSLGNQTAHTRRPGAGKAPDQPCTVAEDKALCSVTTVHHRRSTGKARSRSNPAA
jgi:hypothetical protein